MIQQADVNLVDLEQVWMQLALRAAAEAHVDHSQTASHTAHDSSITVATIHA